MRDDRIPPQDDPRADGQDDPLAERVKEFLHPHVKPLSEVLQDAVVQLSGRVTVGELVEKLSSRGLAPLVLLMGLLNIVTIIPGSSTVLGLPLVFLGISLILGARILWLPRRLRQASFEHAGLEKTVNRAIPYLRRIERLARPRYWPGLDGLMDRIYGALVLFFALLISLPVPFGNMMPAITITLISLGFTARDGLWVVAGLFTGAMAVGVILGFAGAAHFIGMSIFG